MICLNGTYNNFSHLDIEIIFGLFSSSSIFNVCTSFPFHLMPTALETEKQEFTLNITIFQEKIYADSS